MKKLFNKRKSIREIHVGPPQEVRHTVHVDVNFVWKIEDIVSDFTIIEQIGQGTFGAVHRGRHKPSGYEMVIKTVEIEADDGTDSLKNEIEILKRCRHLNIVTYFGTCSYEGRLWVLMDYCAFGSVKDMMERLSRTLTEKEIASICAAILQGLMYLHSRHNIVHKDVKPANILMNESGEVRLGDFGVSEQLSSTLCLGSMAGTPHYMAPEISVSSNCTSKADIWSLGITAIEMAEGKPPYADQNHMRAMFLIRHKSAPTLKNLRKWSPEFTSFVEACLVKDPEARPSAEELLKLPFIRNAKGVSALKNLINQNLRAIKQMRMNKETPGGGGSSRRLSFMGSRRNSTI